MPSADLAILNAFVPHNTLASGANTPKAISEAAALFVGLCGGLTAPSAGEVLSLLHADNIQCEELSAFICLISKFFSFSPLFQLTQRWS